MRYTQKTNIKTLRDTYDVLVGWGTAPMEYESRYNPTIYKLDYLINGKGVNVGEISCGNPISDMSILQELKGKKVCVIIYSNKEPEITAQIHSILSDADIIMGRLVEAQGIENTYSRDREDIILLELIKKICPDDFSYMDIGVCHPVVRNNTYLFYENNHTNGVLVEPNPVMAELAKVYRPKNRMLVCGASADNESTLTYYQSETPGFNTFSKEVAEERGILANSTEIPVCNINNIISDNFETYPDILDIDTEGMDFELLSALDTDKYKIKVICAEAATSSTIKNCLFQKGYVHYCTTIENHIYIRKEELDKILNN